MNSRSDHPNNLKNLVRTNRHFELISCPQHQTELVKGICLFRGPCRSRLICRVCRKHHPDNHLNQYEELEDFLSGSLVKDITVSIGNMLKQIDTQNKNLQKLLLTASNRISTIVESFKKKIDTQARAATSRLSELIDYKVSQNSTIREELIAASADFEHMFNQAVKTKGHSPASFEALEEILSLYNNITTNYIDNPDYQRQLEVRHIDESSLFDMNAIHFRLKETLAMTSTLFSEISDHFNRIPALKFEEIVGAPEFKMKVEATFDTGHKEIKVGALAYIPPLNYLLTGGTEGSIKIWNLDDLKLVSKQVAHKNQILRIVYIPQKDMVASGGKDGEVKLWKIRDNALHLVGTISYDNAGIYAVNYLPNGNLLATGGDGPEIRLWEMVFTGFEPNCQIINTGSLRISSLLGLDNLGYLVAGTDSGTLLVYGYNKEQHRLIYRLPGHKKDVFAMDCDQERGLLVSGSDDGCIMIWILRENDAECIRRMRKEGTTIRSLAFLIEKDIVLSTHGDEFIRAWNNEKSVMCGSYLNDSDGGAVCRLSEQSNQIVSAFADNIKIWSFY